MRDKLKDLAPEFGEKINELLDRMQAKGFNFVPYCTMRSPENQARLWRQSRTRAEVDSRIAFLRDSQAWYLADILVLVGKQPMGPWRTNALPGLSWHQWGEAVDCYLEAPGGGTDWHNELAYEAYAQEAGALGLTAGRFLPQRDSVHIQHHLNSPNHGITLAELSEIMQRRFAQ